MSLATIIALLLQTIALVRWATKQEAKLDRVIEEAKTERERLASEVETKAKLLAEAAKEIEQRVSERLVVLERNGSPAVRSLGKHLELEQVELERILAKVEENSRAIQAVADRVTRVEAACNQRHNGK